MEVNGSVQLETRITTTPMVRNCSAKSPQAYSNFRLVASSEEPEATNTSLFQRISTASDVIDGLLEKFERDWMSSRPNGRIQSDTIWRNGNYSMKTSNIVCIKFGCHGSSLKLIFLNSENKAVYIISDSQN